MPYGTVNADVIQTSTSGGILGAGNASIMKNRIINGAMVISQRNGTSSVTPTNGQYVLDRFQYNLSQTSKITTQQSTTAPVGFVNSLLVTSSSAYSVTSTDYFTVTQPIEGFNVADLGWGTANAKTVTLSAWVYSSLTGTFGGSILNGSFNYAYPFSYTISSANTWTQISVTIAGPTAGTWTTDNSSSVQVNFSLGSGSTRSGTAGAWNGSFLMSATGAVSVVGTSGATWYITGVQLEVGSSATGFEYRIYSTELANCQRYAQRFGGDASYAVVGFGFGDSNNGWVDAQVTPPSWMRTVPSVTSSGNFRLVAPDNTSGLAVTGISIDTSVTSSKLFYIICTASSITGFRGYLLRADNSTSAYILFSAEL
jgi:hypothetical protein